MLTVQFCSGQEDTKDIPTESWIAYTHFHNMKGNWEWNSDQAIRYSLLDRSWWRIHVKPGIHLDVSNHIELIGGIGFFFTRDEIEPDRFEIRPWQGIIYSPGVLWRLYADFKIQMEERFVRNNETKAFEERWLIRPKINLNMPINNPLLGDKTWFMNFFSERFIDISNNLSQSFQDRTRISLGTGYRINTKSTWAFNIIYQDYREENSTDNFIFRLKLKRNIGY